MPWVVCSRRTRIRSRWLPGRTSVRHEVVGHPVRVTVRRPAYHALFGVSSSLVSRGLGSAGGTGHTGGLGGSRSSGGFGSPWSSWHTGHCGSSRQLCTARLADRRGWLVLGTARGTLLVEFYGSRSKAHTSLSFPFQALGLSGYHQIGEQLLVVDIILGETT